MPSFQMLMELRGVLLGLSAILCIQVSSFASNERAEFDAQLGNAIAKLNREVAVDSEGSLRIAELLAREYGAREEEMKMAAENDLSWGEIAVFAYIQATTGRSFDEMIHEDARRDFWIYVEKAGMNYTKMADSLDQFIKQAERERNSRIFERLRASRRVHRLPDLGSGFGLFQEALDFRRIDSPSPIKVHTDPGARAKVVEDTGRQLAVIPN
jgi:hypothetical protein